MTSLRERQRKAPPPGPGQMRWQMDMVKGAIFGTTCVPDTPLLRPTTLKQNDTEKTGETKDKKGKPDIAYMGTENLEIIRGRISKSRIGGIDISKYEEMVKDLVVFQYGVKIKLSPKEEETRGYHVKFNINVIACKADHIYYETETPVNYERYLLLGIYKGYNGKSKVSENKSKKTSISIQRSDKKHPSFLPVCETIFFAKPEDEIPVAISSFERTSFYWRK